MSNEKNAPAPAAPKITERQRDSIAVAMLKFDDRYPVEVPGTQKTALTGMAYGQVFKDGERVYMGPCWVIDFLPAIRHHRVVHFSGDAKPPQVRMIHESLVRAWEPLES